MAALGAAIDLALGAGTLARAQRAALVVFAIRIAGAGLAYATQVLLARLMGKAEYGIFATVWVWLAILGHGCLWGVSQSACRFLPRYMARGEGEFARGFLWAGTAFTLVSAIATAAVAAAILWGAADLVGAELRHPFLIALLVLPLFALQDFVEGVARAFHWTGLAIAPLYLLRQGLIAVFMLAAVAAGLPGDPGVAIACALAATAVALAVQGGVLLRRLRAALAKGPRSFRIREWSTATGPIAFVDLTTLGLSYVDVIILGFFLEPEAVGVYFAATRILQFVVFAQYAASAATAQRFSEAAAQEDRALLRGLVVRTARLTALMTLVTACSVLAAAPLLLAMFGPGFAASLPILAIMAAGVAVQSVFGPAEDVLNMLGGERAAALVSLASLGIAIILNLALIPAFGPVGAAAAMAVTGALRGGILSFVARHRLGLSTHVMARA